MTNKKNEKWDGYFKTTIKDPIWWDAIPEIKATELTADTTRKFVKASGEAWNSTQTMNPRIAFLDAIGQLDYQDNFYIATESLHSNEDFTLTSRACEVEKFLRESNYEITSVDSIFKNGNETKIIQFKDQNKKYNLELKELK